jgi:tRNA threonylcarbamoyladenosine biosynthesis protein TsaE
MEPAITRHYVATSPEETLKLAVSLGSRLRGGEVIELVSDLGGGKTTFIRGLAEGMGSHEMVSSPSFTISKQYRAGELTLHHYDFYRLTDPGIVGIELAEVLGDLKSVVVVEWASIVDNVLPPGRVSIKITVTGESSREFDMSFPDKFAYIAMENS